MAERIWGKNPSELGEIKFCHCRNCGFGYYNPQPDSEELNRYYNGYRGLEFQRMRERYEPTYTKEYNSLADSPQYQKVRKDLLAGYLKLERKVGAIGSVLDFGGDLGQFIPDELSNAKRYVYEISGSIPNPGIIPLKSMEECRQHQFDMIMCSHVLEHVPDPLAVMEKMVDLAGPDTIIYVELPYETLFKDISPRQELAYRMLSFFKMTFNPWIIMSIITRDSRVNCQLSEHISVFNGKSLRKMLERSNLDVLRMDVAMIGIESDTPILRCLAKKIR